MTDKLTYEELEKKIQELEKAESKRKRAEDELQMSEEKFRVLFEKSIHGILIVDIETRRFPYANPAFCQMFGYSASEMLQIGVEDIHPKDALDYILSVFSRQKKGKKAGATELPCIHKDGMVFNADIAATNIVINHRKCVVGFFIDITERKQAEKVLQKAHDDLEQRVVERTEDLALANEELQKDIVERKQVEEVLEKTTLDLSERIKELNCLYGISKLVEEEHSIGEVLQGTADLIPHSWQYSEITYAKIIFQQQEYKTDNFKESEWVQSQEILILGKKVGTIMVCYLEEKPEIDEGPFLKEERELINAIAERLGHILAHKQAEKEKEKLQARLNQAQKMESIGTLAGGIAHDLNNILYPIIGFTQMSMEELPKTHLVQENLQDILDSAKRARDMVKQILLFSRQKKQVLKPTILTPVVKETIKLLRSTIPKNIDIQIELYNGEDHILCDATEIHEIVMNLCTNAYHAIEIKGGKIKVSLNKTKPDPKLNLPLGEYICLSVSDNGTGIPKNMIDKIFEP